MASLPSLPPFPQNYFKKPLSFGHFKWSDEMLIYQKPSNNPPQKNQKICFSELKIVENGDIAHALTFFSDNSYQRKDEILYYFFGIH